MPGVPQPWQVTIPQVIVPMVSLLGSLAHMGKYPPGSLSPKFIVPQAHYHPEGTCVQVSMCRCLCAGASVQVCPYAGCLYACVCVQESMRRYLCADVHIQMSCVQVPCADVCVQVSVCRCQDHIAQVHLFGCMLAIVDPLTLHKLALVSHCN